jgi:hypothetical protein
MTANPLRRQRGTPGGWRDIWDEPETSTLWLRREAEQVARIEVPKLARERRPVQATLPL